jgi:hypothetical protein
VLTFLRKFSFPSPNNGRNKVELKEEEGRKDGER